MRIGFVGLGKMGSNMVERLLKGGHEVAAYDVDEKLREDIKSQGAVVVDSIDGFKDAFSGQKIVWVMVPSGEITRNVISQVADALSEGDIIIDGGNSNYSDSIKTAQKNTKRSYTPSITIEAAVAKLNSNVSFAKYLKKL